MKISAYLQITTLSFLISTNMMAGQGDTTRVDLSVGADVVSHYIWRGLMLSNSPSIQPSMSVSYYGFSFGSWASYSLSPAEFQEVDLFLTYSAGSFTFGINDYYNPVDLPGEEDSYFNFRSSTTGHTLEPFVTWSEIAGTPLSATAAVFAYGNDRNEEGHNQYSSYFELAYSTGVGDYGLDFFAGATFNRGYYSDNIALVNLGASISRDIRVTEGFSVPCKGSLIVNPDTQNIYFVIGFTL